MILVATATTVVSDPLHSLHHFRKSHSASPKTKNRLCTRASALPESLLVSAPSLSGLGNLHDLQKLAHTQESVTSQNDAVTEFWRGSDSSGSVQRWGIVMDTYSRRLIAELGDASVAGEATVDQARVRGTEDGGAIGEAIVSRGGGSETEDGSSLAGDGDASGKEVFESNAQPDWGGEIIEFFQNFPKRFDAIQEVITRADYSIKSTSYSPAEGRDVFEFATVTVGLLFVFWLGNYFLPDLIFKDTVFRKETPNDVLWKDTEQSETEKASKTSKESLPLKATLGDRQSPASQREVTGFGQGKQPSRKGARRK